MPSTASFPPTKPSRFALWHSRVLAFCFIVFAFELGLFLIVFPWLDSWRMSWVPLHSARWARLWMSPYFRGALSGLGFLNVYVAFAELAKQLRSIFAQLKS